jgi:hypothetical protein
MKPPGMNAPPPPRDVDSFSEQYGYFANDDVFVTRDDVNAYQDQLRMVKERDARRTERGQRRQVASTSRALANPYPADYPPPTPQQHLPPPPPPMMQQQQRRYPRHAHAPLATVPRASAYGRAAASFSRAGRHHRRPMEEVNSESSSDSETESVIARRKERRSRELKYHTAVRKHNNDVAEENFYSIIKVGATAGESFCDAVGVTALDTSGYSKRVKKAIKDGKFSEHARNLRGTKMVEFMRDPVSGTATQLGLMLLENHMRNKGEGILRGGTKRRKKGRREPESESSDSSDSERRRRKRKKKKKKKAARRKEYSSSSESSSESGGGEDDDSYRRFSPPEPPAMDELDELDRKSRERRRAARVARQTEMYDAYVRRQADAEPEPEPEPPAADDLDRKSRRTEMHDAYVRSQADAEPEPEPARAPVCLPRAEVELLEDPGGSDTEVRHSSSDSESEDDGFVEDDPVMPSSGVSVSLPSSVRLNEASAAMSKIMSFTPMLAAGSEAVGQQLEQKDRSEALEKEKPTEMSLDDLLG